MAKKTTSTARQQATPASPLAQEIKAAIAKAEKQANEQKQELERELDVLQKQRTDINAKIESVQAQLDGLRGDIAEAFAQAAKSAGIRIATGARRGKKKLAKKAGKRGAGKSAEQERDLLLAHLRKSKSKVKGEALKQVTGVGRNVSILLSGVKGVRSSGEKRGKVYWWAGK